MAKDKEGDEAIPLAIIKPEGFLEKIRSKSPRRLLPGSRRSCIAVAASAHRRRERLRPAASLGRELLVARSPPSLDCAAIRSHAQTLGRAKRHDVVFVSLTMRRWIVDLMRQAGMDCLCMSLSPVVSRPLSRTICIVILRNLDRLGQPGQGRCATNTPLIRRRKVLCAAYAVNNGPVNWGWPGDPVPPEWIEAEHDPSRKFLVAKYRRVRNRDRAARARRDLHRERQGGIA